MSMSTMGDSGPNLRGDATTMGDSGAPRAYPAMVDDQRSYLNAMMYAQSLAIFANATRSGIVPTLNWITVTTFANSWASFGGFFGPVQYALDLLGFVCLRGALASGTVGSFAFTLPVGFRPSIASDWAVSSGSAPPVFGSVLVRADGTVTPAAGSNLIVNLAQIRFPLT